MLFLVFACLATAQAFSPSIGACLPLHRLSFSRSLPPALDSLDRPSKFRMFGFTFRRTVADDAKTMMLAVRLLCAERAPPFVSPSRAFSRLLAPPPLFHLFPLQPTMPPLGGLSPRPPRTPPPPSPQNPPSPSSPTKASSLPPSRPSPRVGGSRPTLCRRIPRLSCSRFWPSFTPTRT